MWTRRARGLTAASGGVTLFYAAVLIGLHMASIASTYDAYRLGAFLALFLDFPSILLLLAGGLLPVLAAVLQQRGTLLAGAILQMSFFPICTTLRSLFGMPASWPYLAVTALGVLGLAAFLFSQELRQDE